MPVFEENKDTIDNHVNEFAAEFYNPLSLSGYLTPLQRKKLREKRNLRLDEFTKPTDVKKLCGMKRKKEHSSNVSSKFNVKAKRTKEGIPGVQCTAAKIVKRNSTSDNKRKFFKTSSLNRLEKANFTMPLVLKKKIILGIDKRAKETLSCARKLQENANVTENPSRSSEASITGKENYGPIAQSCRSGGMPVSDGENCTDEEVSEVSSLFDFDWPSDESLLKRQAEARANFRKLNSLKESSVPVKQIDTIKEKQSSDAKPLKLYPIFHMTAKQQAKNTQHIKSAKDRVKRKLDASKNCDQMIIDAGQKEIGAKICSTCNMLYTVGEAHDEKLHSSYHNDYLVNLKFPGWKNENVIGEYSDGRVIMVKKDDKSAKLKKIEDILTIANRDLGFPSSALPTKPDLVFILFVSNSKQVAGCVVAEPISSACQVLLAESELTLREQLNSQSEKNFWRIGNWYSSSEAAPALCGVNRIWVAHTFRRTKVASRMIDCLRCNFIYGHVVGLRELAFTDPSPDGRAFAAAYTGTDNFLVYR